MITKEDLNIFNDVDVYLGRVQVAELECYNGKYTIRFSNSSVHNNKSVEECVDYIVEELNGKF